MHRLDWHLSRWSLRSGWRLTLLLLVSWVGWIGTALPARAGDDAITWPVGLQDFGVHGPDLGFLNHRPAGIRGRVLAVGDGLVFEDGTPARFWGANLQARALFRTEPDNIRVHARRIAALGFNLVRVHHHDSVWVRPNVFGSKAPATLTLEPKSMQRLDEWIAALKAEGVYLWLDLHAGRKLTAADGVTWFEEIAKGKAIADMRGFNYVSISIQGLMLAFQDAYLGHFNPLTGLSYADDPAVIAVLITNENDVTHHFGNALLPNKNVPKHSALYTAQAEDFARKHGLSRRATWRSWEFGAPKRFLNDLERRFNERMIAGVRQTGFRGLIATTNLWGGNSIAALPALTIGSIIDAHSYGAGGELAFDPLAKASFLDWIAFAQVAGRPLSISEWNVSAFPVEDRFTAPLRVAAVAAHQGWDAPMVYGYAQQPLNGPLWPGNWDIAGDPAMIRMMPAAALLYRRGHVRPAAKTYAMCLDEETFYGNRITPETSVAVRTIVEQSQLVVCMPRTRSLPWLDASSPGDDDIVVSDPDLSYLAPDATEVVADTGDFRRDFARGRMIVDTPRSQIVAGAFAGDIVGLSNLTVRIETPMAAVAVQSVDDAPLTASGRVLVSITARAVPIGRPSKSYRIEPVRGVLRFEARPALKLWRLGKDRTALPDAHRVEDGIHVIDLAKAGGGGWLILE